MIRLCIICMYQRTTRIVLRDCVRVEENAEAIVTLLFRELALGLS
jgi:hypothetical protein